MGLTALCPEISGLGTVRASNTVFLVSRPTRETMYTRRRAMRIIEALEQEIMSPETNWATIAQLAEELRLVAETEATE